MVCRPIFLLSVMIGLAFSASTVCDDVLLTHALPNSLDSLQARLHRRAIISESVTWETYAADPTAHTGKMVYLYESDFQAGTLRITAPAYFVFHEDVVVDPNADKDYRPDPDTQPQYAGEAYRLGFFAAITVEAPDVVIDLQGHSLTQSVAFALQQRFYAHIELADRPFLPGQGPGHFGSTVMQRANGCIVRNGYLGLSSHHGVHHNGAENILFDNLTFRDYEVAAISNNGGHNIVIRDVNILGVDRNVPVAATYSSARFLLPFIDMALSLTDEGVEKDELVGTSNTLRTRMDEAFSDIVDDGQVTVNPYTHEESAALFGNGSGVFDGNAYGILFHGPGVAVDAFADDVSKAGGTSHVLIANTRIQHTVSDVQEIVALQHVASGAVQKGPAGAILRVADIMDRETGEYVGDALSDAVITLAQVVRTLDVSVQYRFGTLAIDEAVVAWYNGNANVGDLVEGGIFRYRRNGDTMFHVNKGVVALRIDSTESVCVRDTYIYDTENMAGSGLLVPLPGEDTSAEAVLELRYYTGIEGDTHGHPKQTRLVGYTGTDSRGIGIAASTKIGLRDVMVTKVRSSWGQATGIDMFNGSYGCVTENSIVSGVYALTNAEARGQYDQGKRIGFARGIHSGNPADIVGEGDSLAIDDIVCPIAGLAVARASTDGSDYE